MHFTHGRTYGSRTSLLVAVLTLGLLACTRSSAQAVDDEAAGASQEVWQLAEEGRLDEALDRVKDLTADAEAGTALASLRRDINSHEEHVRVSREKAQTQFDRHIKKLGEQLEKDDLTGALITATRAHDLAEDPDAMLREEAVSKLVSSAVIRAEEQEKAGGWLKALDLYRGLSALYETTDGNRFTEDLRRVSTRVSVLRLYAPKVFYEIYKQNLFEAGEKDPPPWNFEEDGWHTRLEGITLEMLTEALGLASESHVESTGYESLMAGGLEQLRVLATTPGLEATFPSLGDMQGEATEFVARLDAISTDLLARDPNDALSDRDARKVVERVMEANSQTVVLPDVVLFHEFGDGAMSKLDEFSGCIWPHEKTRFDRTTTQKFSGVGIQISVVDRQLTVVTPLEDTPAHKAGIRPGERIVTIDGKSTIGLDIDAAVDKITGTEGTRVTLGIQAPGEKSPREITLTRTSIKIVSVKGWSRGAGGAWEYYIDPDLKIGYVRMTTFGPDTAEELDRAVDTMLAGDGTGLNGLILDLRFNPGGRLDAAIQVGDRFLDEGVIVSTTQKLITGGTWEAKASGGQTYPNFPVIVLTNKGSASASEIVSGALKDHGRALIVGQRSFGKGSVQNLFPIGDRLAYLKLTTQYYKIPSGQVIHRRPGATQWGVDPDIEVRMTDQQTVDSIQARTLMDILRGEGEPLDPHTVINTRDEEDADAADPLPPIHTAQDILTLGLDPQLETALLLLKTRILGEPRG